MSPRRVFAALAAAVIGAAVLAPAIAEAQTKRKPSKIVVTPRSYLNPGREVPAKSSYDYMVDPNYAPTRPWQYGPGGESSFSNLPRPFEVPGMRPLRVDFRAPWFLMQ